MSFSGHAPRERVSWNSVTDIYFSDGKRHAPRERVSWNLNEFDVFQTYKVTLHVSVWVEICNRQNKHGCKRVTLHVSVWVEMIIFYHNFVRLVVTLHVSVWVEIKSKQSFIVHLMVTLHVSVWVEMYVYLYVCIKWKSRSTWACELKWQKLRKTLQRKRSRSTWACELKYIFFDSDIIACSHAPRERVSWNNNEFVIFTQLLCHAPRERVSWNTIIKFWLDVRCSKSRSTWACELKFRYSILFRQKQCHAPRERVSWNSYLIFSQQFETVTLHVSVWVEIYFCFACFCCLWVTLHVSVWVEIFHEIEVLNCVIVTLHVSVWVEIAVGCRYRVVNSVTLHVSVWVEIRSPYCNYIITLSRSTWACELKCGILQCFRFRYPSRSTWACELKYTWSEDNE